MTVALYGFKARGSPYTVRVLALKLEEEGDQMEVSLLNSSYNKFSFSFLEIFGNEFSVQELDTHVGGVEHVSL